MNNYWLSRAGGEAEGPFAESQIVSMWNNGQFAATDLLCMDGADDWQPASVIILPPKEPAAPPLLPYVQSPMEVPAVMPRRSKKKKQSSASELVGGCAAVFVVIAVITVLIMIVSSGTSSTHRALESDAIPPDGHADAQVLNLQALARQSGGHISKFSNTHVIEGREWRAARVVIGSSSMDMIVAVADVDLKKCVVAKEFIAMLSLGYKPSSPAMMELRAMVAELD